MLNTRRSRIGALAGSIVVCAAFAGVSQVIIVDRADQKSDFTSDLAYLGYQIITPTSWDDESNGFWAGSSLEVEVRIAGCTVELERSDSEGEDVSDAHRSIGHFRIDQAGPVENIKKSPHGALTPTDVEAFLRSNYPTLGCLTKK